MKIGIMTFHKSINYGSVLQAYALAYKLREMGHEPEIIDYEPHNYNDQYQIIQPPFSMKAVKHDFVNLTFYRAMKNRKAAFEQFRKKHLPLTSKEYYYGDDLSELNGKYDLFICGSDQIWNTDAADFDTAYFFPFISNTPKIAYAVSLNKGELSNTAEPERLKESIMDFKALSSREVSGQKKIYDFIDGQKDVHVVLDPTLLNDKSAYQALSEKRIIDEQYIFFYSINYASAAVKAASLVAERLNLPVYTLVNGKGSRALYNMKKGGKIKIIKDDVSPEDFLSLICHAEKVVTNSFHGTAFSIIFEKDFYSVQNIDETGNPKNDTRIFNILNFLEIQDRYKTVEELKTTDLTSKIDYSKVKLKRDEQIQESIHFLKTHIENR